MRFKKSVTETFFRFFRCNFFCFHFRKQVALLKSCKMFFCEKCDYICSRKSSIEKHFKTIKHMETKSCKKLQKVATTFDCICGKIYSNRTGLWKHYKTCNIVLSSKNIEEETEVACLNNDNKNIINIILQENKEFKQLLIEQNKMMMDIINSQHNAITNITHNNNNVITQNNNNNFNLNFFLNETCKDAMNINDFIKSLDISPDDVEKFGKNGYVSGMTSLITKGLKALDITKRPIHCTDLKREVLHIKDGNNNWIKEIDVLIDALKKITNNNIAKIEDWKKANPGYDDYYNKLNDLFIMITMNSMGPTEKEEEERDYTKIIKNISKITIINKHDC